MKTKIQNPLLLFFVMSALSISCDQQAEKKEAKDAASTNNMPVDQQQKANPDKNILVGEWLRTDAPYVIKISELLDDGKMKAGYFNPKSINIGNATWNVDDGDLKAYIELRDENYPGSNYKLTYIPGKGLLAGKYFQAVEGVTYDVGFVKTK